MSEDATQADAATRVNAVGFVTMLLCLVAPCAGFMTVFLALPLGMYGLRLGRSVLDAQVPSVDRAYARTGLRLCIMGVVYSLAAMVFALGSLMICLLGAMVAISSGL